MQFENILMWACCAILLIGTFFCVIIIVPLAIVFSIKTNYLQTFPKLNDFDYLKVDEKGIVKKM